MRTGPLDLVVTGLLVATATFYLCSVRRLRRRERRWPPVRIAAFTAGVALVWVASGSALAARDDSSVTVNVVVHLLLMMVAPPLVVLGRPLTLATQSAGRRTQVRLNRTLRHRLVAAVTHPAPAWVLYLAAMAVMLSSRPVYDSLVSHPVLHDAGHGLLLLTGLMYWQPLLGGDGAHRPSFAVRTMSILANMPFEVLVGLWLRYQTTPVDPINSLADTQAAGEAFIVGATLASTVWLAVVVGQWAAYAGREDRRAAATAVTAGSEWTVPWWVAGDRPRAGGGGTRPA